MVGVVQGGDGGLSRGTAETVAAVEVSNSVCFPRRLSAVWAVVKCQWCQRRVRPLGV
jgi:hypothetical protein